MVFLVADVYVELLQRSTLDLTAFRIIQPFVVYLLVVLWLGAKAPWQWVVRPLDSARARSIVSRLKNTLGNSRTSLPSQQFRRGTLAGPGPG